MATQKRRLEKVWDQPTVPTLEWKDYSRGRQSMYVSVKAWDIKVLPSMARQGWGKWLFQFEGRTDLETHKGLAVTGDIETLAPEETVETLLERWKSVPTRLEGYGFLKGSRGASATSRPFGFTLYCRPEALDWIYRCFLAAFGSSNGQLGIEIVISYPDGVEPEFWKDRWREESWAVNSWRLVSRATRSRS